MQHDQFNFSAPAAQVAKHFVGDEGVYTTEAHYGLGVLKLQLTGSRDSGPGNLYSIVCGASFNGGLYTRAGYIALKASEGGLCPAVLYLDDEAPIQEMASALQFGRDWFNKFWHDKLEAWSERAASIAPTTALDRTQALAKKRIVASGKPITPKRLKTEIERIQCATLHAGGSSPEIIAETYDHLSVDTVRRRLGLKK